jgi:hypothetical protein
MMNKEKKRLYLLHNLKEVPQLWKIGHEAAQCKSRQVKDEKMMLFANIKKGTCEDKVLHIVEEESSLRRSKLRWYKE